MSKNNTLGFVMMLDVSDSMRNALNILKIDAKAFVRCARPKDQFGINSFSDNAQWVYPTGTNPNILTVSADLKETYAALTEIEKLKTYNLTNMGAAIELGNNMIAKATTDLKAFVMLSDGYHNQGVDPLPVLGSEPPIYIAGLHIITTSYFDKLIAKNPKSKFYNSPNVVDMMQMFNQILADSSQANLALNNRVNYAIGSDYIMEPINISQEDNEAQISVVWSDKKYRYTSGDPSGNNINVILIDPNGKTYSKPPEIDDKEGYCIYNIHDVQPGEWNLLIQYSLAEHVSGTSGGIEFCSNMKIDLDIPTLINSGEKIGLKVNALYDNNQIEGLNIKARLSKPQVCVDTVLNQFETELKTVKIEDGINDTDYARLALLRQEKLDKDGIDILPMKHTMDYLRMDKDGDYTLGIDNTTEKGVYNVDIRIEGINPKTKLPFTSIKSGAVMVR